MKKYIVEAYVRVEDVFNEDELEKAKKRFEQKVRLGYKDVKLIELNENKVICQ